MKPNRNYSLTYFQTIKYFILIVLSNLPSVAFACSCFWSSIDRDYDFSNVVLTATVLEGGIERVNEQRVIQSGKEFTIWDGSIVKLRVDKVWKGDVEQKELLIRTSYSRSMCGYSFKENKRYILFARYGGEFRYLAKDDKKTKNLLWTSLCNSNLEVLDNLQTKQVIEKLVNLQKTQNGREENYKYTAEIKKRIRELIDSN